MEDLNNAVMAAMLLAGVACYVAVRVVQAVLARRRRGAADAEPAAAADGGGHVGSGE